MIIVCFQNIILCSGVQIEDMLTNATLTTARNSDAINYLKGIHAGCINGGVRGACTPIITGPFTGE